MNKKISENTVIYQGRILKERDQFVLQSSDKRLRINIPEQIRDSLNNGDYVSVSAQSVNGLETIEAERIEVLSKCISPIDQVQDLNGLGSLEMLLSQKKRANVILRSKVMGDMRSFFHERGFIEVETPTFRYFPGTSSNHVFTTTSSINNHPYLLRSSPEKSLVRLALNFDKYFEVSKSFRNEDSDSTHSPEFTLVEFYATLKDYTYVMDTIEELVERLAINNRGTTDLPFGDYTISVKRPWKRVQFRDLSKQICDVDVIEASDECLMKLTGAGTSLPRGKLLELFMAQKIEPLIEQPTFITDFPLEMGAPAKIRADGKTMERSELYIGGGLEISNLYTYSIDPLFLQEHYHKHISKKFGKENIDKCLDKDFLFEMGCGIPPLAVGGIGFDRLMMLLANETNINHTMCYSFRK